MDFGALQPEINSARMYAGPGSGSMLAAAAAWNALAAELHSAASSYGSVISELTSGPWVGPSAASMAAAVAPYVTWMSATAAHAQQAATQAQAAAGAYETAFAMTVPPPVIAANRTQLASLTATNFFGQNSPAIAATEGQYGEMWAQDAAAMYSYAANSAATTAQVTPFTAAPQTTNLAGAANQTVAVTQAAGTSAGNSQSTLSQLISSIPTTLQNLASPSSSTSSTSGLSGLLSSLLGGSSSSSTTGFLGGSTSSGFSLEGLLQEYAIFPGYFALFLGMTPLQTLMTTPMNTAFQAAAAAAAPAASAPLAEGAAAAPVAAGGAGAAAGAAAAEGALGSGVAGGLGGFAGLGGLAGLGQAASVGGLSVPSSWGWAATAPAAMLGATPLRIPALAAVPLASNDLGAGSGFPFMFGGLPGAGGAAAAAGTGGAAAAAKYGPRLAVVARPPAAGYPPVPVSPTTPDYPVPAGFPTNGHAPPGYTPAIVYLPTNGHAPAQV